MMNGNNNVRVPNKDKRLGDYFPSRFLKVQDLMHWNVTRLEVEICRATEEAVMPRPGEREWKLVLYFRGKDGNEYPRGYLVSAKSDVDTLENMGIETIGQLDGARVIISMDQWRGKSVLRLGNPHPVYSDEYEEAA